MVDGLTGQVACRDNVTLTGLAMEEADDLADALSWLYRKATRGLK